MEGMVGLIVAGAIVYALFLAVGGGYAYYSTESRERNKAKIVAAAAQQLGFTGGRGTISGVRGGYRVEVSIADNHENKKVYHEILVGSPGDQGFLPRPLALPWAFDPNDNWLTNSLLGSSIGDDAFDRCFRVDALDSASLAPLDASTRDLLLEARELKMSYRLVDGGLLLLLPTGKVTAERLVGGVEAALLFAGRLAAIAADVPAAIARNAREDRSVAVRLNNLEALVADTPSLALTTETLRVLRADNDPSVRCLAAIHSGEEGFETLIATLRAPGIDIDLFGRALARIVSALPIERARPRPRRCAAGLPKTTPCPA